MSAQNEITIEGYLSEEILHMPDELMDAFVFSDQSVIFKVGSAEILGQFRSSANSLIIELAHIEGGGEGVLPALWSLANRYATSKGLEQVEWIVYAIHCAAPNLKLRQLLERKGFSIKTTHGGVEAYCLTHSLSNH